MLFDEDIFISRVVRDSEYVIGKSLNIETTFGGIRKNATIKELYDNLKMLGVIPLNSEYLEFKRISGCVEIIYSVSSISGDTSKVTEEYRKIKVRLDLLNLDKLKTSIIKEVKNYLNSYYFIIGRKVELISQKDENPYLAQDSIERGLKLIRKLNSVGIGTFKNTDKIDNSVYCTIEGRKYILSTIESKDRSLLIMPTDYSEEGILEYLKIITSKEENILKELLVYIMEE